MDQQDRLPPHAGSGLPARCSSGGACSPDTRQAMRPSSWTPAAAPAQHLRPRCVQAVRPPPVPDRDTQPPALDQPNVTDSAQGTGATRTRIADSVRMTIALDAPCTAGRTSCSGSCSVLGRLVAGSDSFNHVLRPTSSPVANRAAPGAAVAQGEGVPSAGASDTAGGYLQQPLRARSRSSRRAVCSRPGAGRNSARPVRPARAALGGLRERGHRH